MSNNTDTVKSLAEQNGITKNTLMRWIKKGKIKHKKEGNTIQVDLTSFWTWCYKDWGIDIPN